MSSRFIKYKTYTEACNLPKMSEKVKNSKNQAKPKQTNNENEKLIITFCVIFKKNPIRYITIA